MMMMMMMMMMPATFKDTLHCCVTEYVECV